MDRRSRSLLVIAAGAVLSVACTGDGSQVTESNVNHPVGGFGSFDDPQNDSVERTIRSGEQG